MGFYLDNEYISDAFLRYNLLNNNKIADPFSVLVNNVAYSDIASIEDQKLLEKLNVEIPDASLDDLLNSLMEILSDKNIDMMSALSSLTRPHLLAILFLLYEGRITENEIKDLIVSFNHRTRTELLLSYLRNKEEEPYIEFFGPLRNAVKKMVNYKNPFETATLEERKNKLKKINSISLKNTDFKFLHGNYYYADKGKDSIFYYCPVWFDTVDEEFMPEKSSKGGRILSNNKFNIEDFFDKTKLEWLINKTSQYRAYSDTACYSSYLRRNTFIDVNLSGSPYNTNTYSPYMYYREDLPFVYSSISYEIIKSYYADHINVYRDNYYPNGKMINTQTLDGYIKEFVVGYGIMDFFEDIINHKHEVTVKKKFLWWEYEVSADFDPVYPSGYNACIKTYYDEETGKEAQSDKYVTISVDRILSNLITISAYNNAIDKFNSRLDTDKQKNNNFTSFSKKDTYLQILFAKEFETFFKNYVTDDSKDENGNINFSSHSVNGINCALIDWIDHFNLFEFFGWDWTILQAKGIKKGREYSGFDSLDMDIKKNLQFFVKKEKTDELTLDTDSPENKKYYMRGLYHLLNSCMDLNNENQKYLNELDGLLTDNTFINLYSMASSLNKDFLKYFIITQNSIPDNSAIQNVINMIKTSRKLKEDNLKKAKTLSDLWNIFIDCINSAIEISYAISQLYNNNISKRVSTYDDMIEQILELDLLMTNGNTTDKKTNNTISSEKEFSIYNFGTINFYEIYMRPLIEYFNQYNNRLLSTLYARDILDKKSLVETTLVEAFNKLTPEKIWSIFKNTNSTLPDDIDFYMTNFKDLYLLAIAKEIIGNYILYLFPNMDKVRLTKRVTKPGKELLETIIDVFSFKTLTDQADESIPAVYKRVFLLRHFILGLDEAKEDVLNSKMCQKLLNDPCNCNKFFEGLCEFSDQLKENRFFQNYINDLSYGKKSVTREYFNQYKTFLTNSEIITEASNGIL